jgi:hypothetical protein
MVMNVLIAVEDFSHLKTNAVMHAAFWRPALVTLMPSQRGYAGSTALD